jgi:hypothetical protein
MHFDHLCGLFAPKVFPSGLHSTYGLWWLPHDLYTILTTHVVCLPPKFAEDSILHHSRLTFTHKFLLLCNYVIDNLCFDDYYQAGSIYVPKSNAIVVWCGGLDSRIDNGEFFYKEIDLQLKVQWVVVALNDFTTHFTLRKKKKKKIFLKKTFILGS